MKQKLDQQQNQHDLFGPHEFVMTKQINDDGESQFIGGGYKVDSFFLKNQISPLTTFNTNNQNNQSDDFKGGKVSSPFENLAVPAGLFYINQKMSKRKENAYNKNEEDEENEDKHYSHSQHTTAPDNLIDKLLGLVEVDKKKKRKTRKQNQNIKNLKNKITRRK